MSSLASLLPKPKNRPVTDEATKEKEDEVNVEVEDSKIVSVAMSQVPAPRTAPELNLMVLPRDTNEEGKTMNYDLIAQVGHGEDRRIQTRLSDTLPKYFSDEQLARPCGEEVEAVTQSTYKALQQLVLQKTSRIQTQSGMFSVDKSSEIIKYQSSAGLHPENNSARLIKMVTMPTDPLEPPKFKHKRIPRAPPSPPAPRLHSPPRKVSAEEQKSWYVPPCISSWKNPKGYTVPLDKRLASDARATQEKVINSRTADLAEALFLAEKHNKEEIMMRAEVERKLSEQERRKKDEQLRIMAENARLESRKIAEELERAAREEEEEERRRRYRQDSTEDAEQDNALTIKARERLRKEISHEVEREYRLSKLSEDKRKAILNREAVRDISEQIALGKVNPNLLKAGEESVVFDERLFDRSQGIGAGLGGGDDDVYNLYDRPLFGGGSSMHMIYRPTVEGGTEGDVTVPAEGSNYTNIESSAPVEFEKGASMTAVGKRDGSQDDPFGLDRFLAESKRGKRS